MSGNADPTVIAVDAMGGDRGPEVVVAGLGRARRIDPNLRFRLHGPRDTLAALLRRNSRLREACVLVDADRVVRMDDKPSAIARRPVGTSMWETLTSVADGRAQAAVSCGNTGALMALATLRLGRAAGVGRPAIAVLWPARVPQGHTVALDVGATLTADPHELAAFAAMGAEYARVGLDVATPRVGLLNVGSEETKGRGALRDALGLIEAGASAGGYACVGFVEGGDLCGDRADVIVTDGFTGNVALKSAEGAASFVGDELRGAFRRNWLRRVVGVLALPVVGQLKRRIDPRRVNGGVFLGLDGAVVKSHGGADATGVAAAVHLAARMARTGFAETVAAHAARLAHAPDASKAAS